MFSIKEFAQITGVSVRTLHHYHSIGVLIPCRITESGYRLYDEKSLDRMKSILIYKELEFSLREIKSILDSDDFDVKKAVDGQIAMLTAKKERLENIIEFAKRLKKGDDSMNFKAFDDYKSEAKDRWGNTDEYRQCEKKQSKKTPLEQKQSENGLMAIFREFGEVKNLTCDDEKVMLLVEKLKGFITENYYDCTNEILMSLGDMYVSDKRFKANIDKEGGTGTAEFVKKAIGAYCMK